MEVEERVGNGFQLPGDPVGRTVTGCGEEDAGVVGEKIEERAGGGFVRSRVGGGGEPQGGGAPGEGAGPGVGVPDAEERVGLPLDEQVVAEGARSWPAGRSSPQRTASAPSRSSSSPAVAPAGTGRIRGSGTGGVPYASTVTPRRLHSGPPASSQLIRTRAPWETRSRRTAWAVTAARTSRAWWNWRISSRSAPPCPYAIPCSRTASRTARSLSEGTSRVKLRNPGPVISTRPMPGSAATRSRRIRATSRAGSSAGPASWSATAQA